MGYKTINFSVCTFRHRKDGECESNGHEFITFNSYSKNLEKAMNELADYIRFCHNKFHSIYILMSEGAETIWQKEFYSDKEFFNFKKKVEDERLDDYKEWLCSNYKDGAR